MATGERVWLAWSTGKDSAYALMVLREQGYKVCALLVTVTKDYDRVSMHGVRRSLLKAQADALGLQVIEVFIPAKADNRVYEAAMAKALGQGSRQGISHIAFGDLFLEDIKKYREERLKGTGWTPLFPLWMRPTPSLSHEIIASGIKARVVALDPRKVPLSLAGAPYDDTFLKALPKDVDPCGENGEFHTLVWNSPDFRVPLSLVQGETVTRDGFAFTDFSIASTC